MSRIRKIRLIPLFVIPMVATLFTFGSSERPLETSAYSEATLPTTIDLNDPNESVIRSYYGNLDNLVETERKGTNLLKNLKSILSNGQKYFRYDSSDSLWKIYEISDRDWSLSPASSTTYGTFDSVNNKITNYVYGSNSDGKNNPYLHALYVNRDATNLKKAWGDHGNRNSEATIEREHIWPKSHGFDTGTAAGARGDPMHLWAADGTANGDHSNNFYGYVDTTKASKDCGEKFASLSGNLSGFSRTLGGTQTIFEPQDSDKGDIARACFYMVARYNNLAGDAEFIDGSEPNLCLINDLSKNGETGQSTETQAYGLGILDDLLEWNKIDPPDEFEIHRNNLLYTNFTNNRNPFIDFPQWADYIWGNQSSFASPATDGLNGGGGGQEVTVTSIKVTKEPTKLDYTAGDTLDLAGMEVYANKSDGTSQKLTSSQYSVSPNEKLKTTDTTVTVSYLGHSDTFAITVQSGGAPTEDLSLSFGFSKNPGDWPTTNSTTLTDYTYTLDDVDYTFRLNNIKCNSGYLMATNPAFLGLPALEGYKLSKVEIKNSGGCSTSTKVGIVTNTEEPTYLAGGEAKQFSNTSTTYTYNLTNSVSGEGYYIYVTNNNCQIVTLNLTYTPAAIVSVTGITLDPVSKNVSAGETFTITPTILPADATNKAVTWSSDDSSIATVTNGVVKGVSVGDCTITATTEDGGFTASCSVTVTEAPVSNNYKLLTNINDLKAGMTIVIACNSKSRTAGDISSQIMSSVNSTFDSENNEITTLGDGTLEFTLGRENDAWTLNNGTANLGATSQGKLAWGSGTTTWSISLDSDSNATIQNGKSDYGRFLYNVTNPRFTTYTSGASSTMLLPQIYYKNSGPAPEIESINLVAPDVIPFGQGSSYTVDATLQATYTDGTTGSLTPDTTNYVIDTTSLGNKTISATYDGKTYSEDIKVTNVDSGLIERNLETSTTDSSLSASEYSFPTDTILGVTRLTISFSGYLTGNTGTSFSHGITFKVYDSNNILKATSLEIKTPVNGNSIGTWSTTLEFEEPSDIAKVSYTLTTRVSGSNVRPRSFDITAITESSQFYSSQANAWASYFVGLTRNESTCLASDDATKLIGLKVVWEELKTEYNAMKDSSKDAFFNETELADIREHYRYIISKFGKKSKYGDDGLEDFVVNSTSVKLTSLNNNRNKIFNFSDTPENIIFISSFVAISVVSLGLYFAIRKKKEI